MPEKHDHCSTDSTPASRNTLQGLKFTEDSTRVAAIALGAAGAVLILTTARHIGPRHLYSAGLVFGASAVALGCTGAIVRGIRGIAGQELEWMRWFADHVQALEAAEQEQATFFRRVAGDELGERRRGKQP